MEDTVDYSFSDFHFPLPAPRSPFPVLVTSGGQSIAILFSSGGEGGGGGRCLQGNLWYSPPASITSRPASVTFKIASKVFINETDKNVDFIMEILFRFLGFGDFKVYIVIEN